MTRPLPAAAKPSVPSSHERRARGSWEPGVVVLLAGFALALLVYAVRDVPAQVAKLRREAKLLSGLDNDTRRLEAFRPLPGDPPARGRTYAGLRRYLAFMDRIRRETPTDARVGLAGVPPDPLGKYAHYFLFPRHPFVLEGRDPARLIEALDLQYVATFEGADGKVERVR